MSTTAKIFISDLHVGEGDKNGQGTADDFTKNKESIFKKLLDYLAQEVNKESELILLGDIFDLIEQKEEDPAKALTCAMDAHKDFVQALRKWLKNGRKIFYITGNHDYALRHAEVASRLVDRLFDNNKSTPWGAFVIDDWYFSKSFRIYAEHGHRFDLSNSHTGTPNCFGDLIVREILRPLEVDAMGLLPENYGNNPLQKVDSARPRGRLVDWIKKLENEKKLKPGATEEIRKKALDLYKKSPDINLFEKGVLDNSVLRSVLITDDMIRKGLNDVYEPYREHAKTMLERDGLQLRDLNFIPKYIVMGHTHFFDKFDLIVRKPDKMAKYINLSSWLDTIYIDKNGKDYRPYEGCPYLKCIKNSNGAVTATLIDATDNQEISNKIIKEQQAQNDM